MFWFYGDCVTSLYALELFVLGLESWGFDLWLFLGEEWRLGKLELSPFWIIFVGIVSERLLKGVRIQNLGRVEALGKLKVVGVDAGH